MANNTEHYMKLEVIDFKGIKDVLIFLDQDNNVALLEGDQGVGKTRVAEALLLTLGNKTKMNINKLKSNDTGELEVILDIDGKVRARARNGEFTVQRVFKDEDGDDSYSDVSSPKTWILKNYKSATIPTNIQYLDGEKIIDWVTSLFPLGDKKEVIEDARIMIKNLIGSRPEINKNKKALEVMLENNLMYKEYIEDGEKLEKKIEKFVSGAFDPKLLDSLQEQAAHSSRIGYEIEKTTAEYEHTLEVITAKQDKSEELEDEINVLYKGLASRVKERKCEEIISVAQGILKLESEHKNVNVVIAQNKASYIEKENSLMVLKEELKKYSDLLERIDEQKELRENKEADAATVQAYKEMKSSLERYNELETSFNNIQSNITDLQTQVQLILAEGIPQIDRVEIELYDFEREAGVYFDGKHMSQLSESEFAECTLRILQAGKFRFIEIENISSYGSGATAFFNKLAAELRAVGGYIFVSKMDQSMKELKITTTNQL